MGNEEVSEKTSLNPQTSVTAAQTRAVTNTLSPAEKSNPGANSALSSYRLAQGVHRLGSQVHRIAGAFDPDLGDVDGFTDSDYSDSSDDNDSDGESIRSEHSDDQIVHSNDNAHADQSAGIFHSGAGSASGSGSSQPSMGAGRGQLPVLRSSKQIENLSTRDVGAISSASNIAQTYNSSSGIAAASPKLASAKQSNPPSGISAASSAPAPAKGIYPALVNSSPKLFNPQKPSSNTTNTALNTLTGKVAETALATEPPPVVAMEIVRVRKPDGTIIRVRRPIRPILTAADSNKPTDEVKASNLEPTQSKPITGNPENGDSSEKVNANFQTPKEPLSPLEGSKTGFSVTEAEKVDQSSRGIPKRLPTKAEVLHRRTSKVTQIIIWSIMISLPLLFLILGVLTAVIRGLPEESSFGRGVTQANQVAVSIWPIAFAAVAAQALRMYASYKVESGLKLMALEQLINSHSVASAIKQPFLLQRINWTSISLLCLWSLSPLAGQALLRMSYIDNSGAVSNTTVSYLNTTMAPVGFGGIISGSSFSPNVDALLGTSILAPQKAQLASMDTWGNIKIPLLKDLVGSADTNGWISANSATSYASLLGVPLSGINGTSGNTSFIILAAYLTFDFPAVTELTLDEINATAIAAHWGLVASRSTMLYVGGTSPSAGSPGYLCFASKRSSAIDATYAYTASSFNQTYVEANVLCSGTECKVDKMRSVAAPYLEPYGVMVYPNWISNFAATASSGSYGTSSLTQYFINDTSSASSNQLNNVPDLFTVPKSDFNTRLDLLLNTYWFGGIAPFDMTGKILSEVESGLALSNTTATATSTAPVYHVSWGWLILLLISSVILLLGGVAGAICDSQTVGPDIFGFASSLAHKNKYMRVPTGDSTMGGPQRARILGDVTVMLQDVKPDQEVGKIALGTVENGGKKLQHGRLYK